MPNASKPRMSLDGWRDLDGITVAKRCVAFLIAVLVAALLAVAALAILTNVLEASGKSGRTASDLPVTEASPTI